MLQFLVDNTLARLILLGLIFGFVMLAAIQAINRFTQRAAIRAELDEISERSRHMPGERLGRRKESAWSKLADQIEKSGLSLTDTNNDELRDKLRAAGFESPSAPRYFTMLRLLCIFLLPALYVTWIWLTSAQVSTFKLYLFVIGAAAFGMYLPNLIVSAKADRRREQVINGFPDCLDLLLVCVEAGLGLEAAMVRVSREMVESHPLVAKIISTATLQLRAGAEREVALRRMGELSGVEEIRSFSTLLIQSDKLGTSVATTLRVYAAEMREKRKLRAEEKAHRLPVLISIPLVVCMLPTMISVLMLPGVVRTVRVLIPTLGG